MQGNREFIYLVPAAKHFADYRPYDLKIVPHTTVAPLSDYSTMSAAGVTHFFRGQVSCILLPYYCQCSQHHTAGCICYARITQLLQSQGRRQSLP